MQALADLEHELLVRELAGAVGLAPAVGEHDVSRALAVIGVLLLRLLHDSLERIVGVALEVEQQQV